MARLPEDPPPVDPVTGCAEAMVMQPKYGWLLAVIALAGVFLAVR
jgi:hypothetical protein